MDVSREFVAAILALQTPRATPTPCWRHCLQAGSIPSRNVEFPMTMRAGMGKVIAAPATAPRVDAMAIAFAAVVLILAVCPGEGHGAQRSQAALSDPSSSQDAVIERIQSADEQSLRAVSAEWGYELQLAVLSIDSSKLSKDASRAVSRWPAAQKADPAWEWARVLVFLLQTALIVQGHDPGKPDGLMGPKTMLAILAWSAASGPSWGGSDKMSFMAGLADNAAHLLHGTLEALGLSPGPKDRFLGRESVTALERWDDTFRRAGVSMFFDEDAGKRTVTNEFGAAGPSDAAAGPSEPGEAASRSRGRGNSAENSDSPNGLWGAYAPFILSEGRSTIRGYGFSYNYGSMHEAIFRAIEECERRMPFVPSPNQAMAPCARLRVHVFSTAHTQDLNESAPVINDYGIAQAYYFFNSRCFAVIRTSEETDNVLHGISVKNMREATDYAAYVDDGDGTARVHEFICNDR